jgi:hypothetical protein
MCNPIGPNLIGPNLIGLNPIIGLSRKLSARLV